MTLNPISLLHEIVALRAEIERRKAMEIRLSERVYLAFEVIQRNAEKRENPKEQR